MSAPRLIQVHYPRSPQRQRVVRPTGPGEGVAWQADGAALLPPQKLPLLARWLPAPLDGARQLHHVESELLPNLVSRLEHFVELLVLRGVNQAALKHGAFQVRRPHAHEAN